MGIFVWAVKQVWYYIQKDMVICNYIFKINGNKFQNSISVEWDKQVQSVLIYFTIVKSD